MEREWQYGVSSHQAGKRGAEEQSISPCSFSAAFTVVRLAIGDAVIRWRTDGHLTTPGMELAHHACGLVLAGLAACCFDASPLGCDGLL